ncbi:hypothetical protein APHAL10511_005636 [Amanita phalloides]|nr:hypothetical protein APHAL10511_005636 [Amanita phalloides]
MQRIYIDIDAYLAHRASPAEGARMKRRQLYRATRKFKAFDGKVQSSEPASYFPINKLPQDVLAEIFVFCLPNPELPKLNGSSSKHVAPLMLCNVCSSWRMLALSIPRLWQQLFLAFADCMPKTREKDKATALTDAWLKRSGMLPLTLSLRALGSLDGNMEDLQAIIQAVLHTLVDHASRWEYFRLSWTLCPPILVPRLGHTPCLRTFILTTSRPNIAPFPFSSCPNLTDIFWPYACKISSSPNVPWHQLTCLRLGDTMPLSEMLLLLQACPKLVELRIEVDDSADGALPRKTVITNCSLQKLHLTVYDKCESLLKRLTLPALTDFSLDMDDGFAWLYGVHKQLLRFFSRSKCKLDRLQLRDCDFDGASLLRCLEHPSCAFLTELRIENIQHSPMFTDTVLVALTDPVTGEYDVLLPYLKHLSLEACLAGSPGMLGMMILSRCLLWEKEDQLNHVKVIYEEIHERDYLLIKLAEEQGLSTRFVFACDPYYSDSEATDEYY